MDFQGILQRLRPYSPYLLRDGGGALYTDILEWRDPNTTKPTEAECIAEWNVMLAERAAAKAQEDLVRNTETSAVTNYAILPTWAKTGTAAEAETYINAQIWNGQTQAQVDAWIDANIANITTANVSQINIRLTGIRAGLKLAAGAILATRSLFILTSKLLIYIRDLVIRFRNVP
jgi:hypothetical protein